MNDCCEKRDNRRPGPGPRGLKGEQGADETVEHCVVCSARHFELTVDPLQIGLTFPPVNEPSHAQSLPLLGTNVRVMIT